MLQRYLNSSNTIAKTLIFPPFLFFTTLLGFLGFCWLKNPSSVGVADWDWVFSDGFQSANGFLEHGWFPFWTIQTQGGAPMAGNPESLSQSPLIFILMAAGNIVGVKLVLLLLIGMGIIGCYVLGKHWFNDSWAAACFTFIFIFSGYFAIHLRVGHFPWAFFFFVPWILYFVDRILFKELLYYLDIFGLFIIIFLFMTGTFYHSTIFFLIPLSLCYLVTNVFKAKLRRLCIVVVILTLGCLASLPKLIAVVHWELNNPRHIAWSDEFSLTEVFKMLLLPIGDYKARVRPGGEAIWEYWAFVGIFSFLLALIGTTSRERWRWFAVCLILVGVAMSLSNEDGAMALKVLRGLPIVSSIRVQSRFLALPVFGVALLAGGGVTVLQWRASFLPKLYLILLLSVFIVAEYFIHVIPIWSRVFMIAQEQIYQDLNLEYKYHPYTHITSDHKFQQYDDNTDRFDSRMYPLIKSKVIITNAYTGLHLPQFRPTGDKTIELIDGSSYIINNHRIELFGNFWSGQEIHINLPYHPYWKSAMPEIVSVENDHGLMRLAVRQASRYLLIQITVPWEKVAWIIAGLSILGTLVGIFWLSRPSGTQPLGL